MDPAQQAAYDALLTRPERAIIVGSAGAGKSFVLNSVIAAYDTSLDRKDWCAIMCASHTACAGYGAGRARTIANFVGAGGRDIPSDPDDPRAVKMANKVFERCLHKKPPFKKTTSVVIIDEFGLLSSEQLTHLLNWFNSRCPRIAIWLAGDVGQIVRKPPPWQSSAFGVFLQTASVFSLTANHRIQPEETELKMLLDALRNGTLCKGPMLHVWNHRILSKKIPDDAIIVTAANSTCNKNIVRSAKKKGIELTAVHDVFLSKGKRARIKATFVSIGVGCRVMLTRHLDDTTNLPRKQGTMAHVVSFRTLNDDPIAADNIEIKLKTEGDEPAFSIRGQTSTSTGPSGQPLASTNLSLINAASLTAHRLQGLTITEPCSFDGENAMEPGSPYVCFSRVTSIDQLSARNLSAERADELAPSKEQREWADRLHRLSLKGVTRRQ